MKLSAATINSIIVKDQTTVFSKSTPTHWKPVMLISQVGIELLK